MNSPLYQKSGTSEVPTGVKRPVKKIIHVSGSFHIGRCWRSSVQECFAPSQVVDWPTQLICDKYKRHSRVICTISGGVRSGRMSSQVVKVLLWMPKHIFFFLKPRFWFWLCYRSPLDAAGEPWPGAPYRLPCPSKTSHVQLAHHLQGADNQWLLII